MIYFYQTISFIILVLFFLPLIYLNYLFYTNNFNLNKKQLIANKVNLLNITIIICCLLLYLIAFLQIKERYIYINTAIELSIIIGLIIIIAQCYAIYIINSQVYM